MKLKKVLALALTVVMTASMVVGCGSSQTTSEGTTDSASAEGTSESSGASAPAKEGDEEITWVFWDDLEATDDLMTKQYAETVKRFNEADNGYHVNVVTTNLEEYLAKINAMIAAGQTPDVFIIDPGPRLDTYVNNGVAMDLTDILAKDKEWSDTFTGGIFERLTYDGKIMAVPTNFASACVFYNTEIFEKVGIKETPKTWDEFMADCKLIKDAGYDPISVSAGTPWCLSMIAGYLCDREGGPDNLQGIKDGTAKWTDPTFVDATKKLVDMSQYFQATYSGDSNDQAVANFYNGTAAMLVQGSWAIAQINGNNPEMEDKCGVFQFPGIEGGADPNRMIVKTDNLMISATTKHLDACIAFLKEMTGDTAQKATAEIAGKIPVTNVEIDTNVAPKQFSYVEDVLSNMTGTLGFYNESLASTEAGDRFDNTMVSIVMGQMTPEEGLQDLQDWYDANVNNK